MGFLETQKLLESKENKRLSYTENDKLAFETAPTWSCDPTITTSHEESQGVTLDSWVFVRLALDFQDLLVKIVKHKSIFHQD